MSTIFKIEDCVKPKVDFSKQFPSFKKEGVMIVQSVVPGIVTSDIYWHELAQNGEPVIGTTGVNNKFPSSWLEKA